MAAEESFVTLRIEDWRVVEIVGRDGHRYEVTGYVNGQCPTEKCGALCCQKIPWDGRMGAGPCEFLNQDTLKCKLHEARGPACKPLSCWLWPVRPGDVASINERYADGEKRCYLDLVRVD